MRRWLTAVITAMLAAALPAVAWGSFAWTLAVSPQTATQGQSTVFSLTLTNQGSSKVGCLEVDLPASFVILSLGDPNASNGGNWNSTQKGNEVEVDADGGGAELDQGESVTFTITARPTAAGSFAWTNEVHTKQDCKKKKDAGPPLQVTVAPSGTSAPDPRARRPRLRRRPRRPTRPAPTPTPGHVPPTTASPTPTADRRPTPEASSSDRPSTPAPAPSPGGTGTGGPGTLQLAPLRDSADGTTNDLGTGLDILALLDGQFVWFVPGAAVGVPGLLVIAFVVLQGVGAMAWIPAMRRLGGDDQPTRRRPLRPA